MIIWSVLALGLVTASLQSSAVTASAAEVQIPGARINLDAGFVYDMNAAGDYVIAWSPDDGSKFTKVVRGSALTGPARTWSVASGFASTPDVAIAANGTMALSWTDEPNGQHRGYRVKYGAVWNFSDARIKPHVLGRSHSDWYDNIGSVDLAINDSGAAAFTWVSGIKGERIGFSIGHPDGTFTPSQRIFKDRRAGPLGNPEVSIDNAGDVAVRWSYLGLNCRDDWFVPRHCRNQPSSLAVSTASTDLRFSSPQVLGKGCVWANSDSTMFGQIFAVVLCRSGFKYTTASPGQPFSALRHLDLLQGSRETSSPEVKILENGRVIVAYESLRYNKRVGPFTRIGGSAGTFGSPLGPPSALTPEVDHSDADNQGGYWGNNPLIVEGPGSQPYIAILGPDTNTIAAMDAAGNLGPPVSFRAEGDTQLGVAPGGLGFSVYTKERGDSRRSFRVSLWTSNFAVPTIPAQ